ncbi:diacylglycerol kinase family protein [Streptomyces sp. NPDC006458]|uniref:diacylglycerol kinase family protein n=1 Tax=Streptomyces sp. NPDC006458 TaxID=3154302 RepID=UPI0033A7C224
MPTQVPERPRQLPGERNGAGPAGAGHERLALPRGLRWSARWIGALTICQAALMTGLGLLITGPARDLWPISAEDEVNEALERIRTAALTALSSVASEAGNTLVVIAVSLVSCLGLILVPRLPMWRQAAFLALAVSLQALVFLVVTEAVDRNRPDVERLDGSLPTSSYTSGHTGAATAVYGGLAVLALSRLRRPWRYVVGAVLCCLPILVGVARLYRGMHHPTDVAGGLMNGSLSLLIVGRALLTDGFVAAPAKSAALVADDARRIHGRTVVIFDPLVTGPALRQELNRVLALHGCHETAFIETTVDDPGRGQAAAAARDGAALVVVCGGDGTFRATADALAGTGVPLALVPCGTGNLMARNLGLPLAPVAALDAALRGTRHRIDLGRIEGDHLNGTHFAVMSGAGLDAAMVQRANDDGRAKTLLGWPVYVLAALRVLRTPPLRMSVRLDGAAPLRREARMVLLGNVGTVQGGVRLLPRARPDDGRLDLLLLRPRGFGGWLRALGTLLRGTPTPARTTDLDARGPVEFFTFHRAEFTFDAPQPREVDGDPAPPGQHLVAEVNPGALTVLLPARGK